MRFVANRTVELECGLTVFNGSEFQVRTESREEFQLCSPTESFGVTREEAETHFDVVPE